MLVNDLSRWRKKPQREGGNVASRPDFESIKHLNPYKVEYWEARELMPLLGYKTWREFEGAIERAKISCEATGNSVEDQFVASYKLVKLSSGAERQVSDYSLTCLACYLIARAPVKGIHLSEVIDLVPCGNGDCSVPYF